MPAGSFVKVLVVDDHEMVRRGIRKMIEIEKGITVVGEAANGDEAVAAALKAHPDVVLMDIQMPGMNGLEATRRILQAKPQVAIIMLTVYDDDEYVLEAIKSGAMGYLLKDLDATALVAAIRKVATGESLIDQDVAARLLQDMVRKTMPGASPASALTEREREILEAIAGGMANKEIADKLSISERTVKNHITNIFKKIDVHDRTQAAIFAIREGLAKI